MTFSYGRNQTLKVHTSVLLIQALLEVANLVSGSVRN